MKSFLGKGLTLRVLMASLFTPSLAMADGLSAGDTAWMIMATILVLLMTIPGLSLFYAGMVRSKNVLSVMMQCFAITALMTILWALFGYSLAFGDSTNGFWGGFSGMFLANMSIDSLSGTIPESVFVTFQMTFAIITPALIVGAFAERMKFSAILAFMSIWLIIVYAPVCHWIWGGGWLGSKFAILDFAGGTVVHINAGIAGLVACLVLGKREGYPTTAMPPHNLTLTLIGAAMLWVGWFGFNAGSELAANSVAGMAMLVTQIAAATSALSWMFFEWNAHGKPSALGIASGAVSGLVAITPACGYVGPMGALVIGLVSGFICFKCATTLKRKWAYDDSLDVFSVHAVGGIVGALLTGIISSETLGIFKGQGLAEGVSGIAQQLTNQSIGVMVTIIYSGILSFIILKIIDALIGLRVSKEEEIEGLDLASHGERGYILL